MRMSCNGCRVLRKGCSEDCSIRPCLQWIKNPESQANATVFLAKFYGRAGLMNLINAVPEQQRPDVFKSLLYEACGRILNPIYGSVGLLCSGYWQFCQSAVESVLTGSPIISISSEIAESTPSPPIKGYDIRHAGKEGAGLTAVLHKIGKCRKRFKRPGADAKTRAGASVRLPEPASPESWNLESAESRPENESMSSAEAVEAASHVSQGEPNQSHEREMALVLKLGFEPMSRRGGDDCSQEGRCCEKISPAVEDDFGINLQLELAV